MLPPPIGRIGLAGAHAHVHKRDVEKRGTCNLATGDLYSFPNSSSTIDATTPLTFKWNTQCAMNSKVDLYLYEPTSANGVIHVWQNADFSAGQYTATLQPRWWNDTTTASLQLSILNAGAEPWDTVSPAGPVFKITYPASAMMTTTTVGGNVQTGTAAAAATESRDAVFQDVSSTSSSRGPSKAVIAVAVLIPLIVVGIAVAVAVRFWRAREAEKRKRWSQALSTHSGLEWEKGALPGEKPSSILGRPSTQMGRPSTHFSLNGRPGSMATSSVFAVENNMAGTGAGGGQQHFNRHSLGAMRAYSTDDLSTGNRSSVVLPDGQVRQSRISFADVARPDRRSRLSLGDNLRPVIGKLPGASKSANELVTPRKEAYATGSAIADDDEEINISPSQLQGPGAFADAEMKRVAGGRRTGRKSVISFGGDKRRLSTASALSADDFKSAASARGSVDELRDMEAVMLMRRSMMSQHSGQSPALEQSANVSPELNDMENLDLPAQTQLPTAPAPIAGSSTVAYGPDQMLAVYAARGKINAATTPSPVTVPAMNLAPIAQPKPAATRQNSALRVLGSLAGKRNEEVVSPVSAPAPGDMKSFVHLNKGVVSSSVVDALPPPGPPSLNIPSASSKSRLSEGSSYSEDGVGEAK